MMIIEMPTLKQHLKSRSKVKNYKRLFAKAHRLVTNKSFSIAAACREVGICEETYRNYKKALQK